MYHHDPPKTCPARPLRRYRAFTAGLAATLPVGVLLAAGHAGAAEAPRAIPPALPAVLQADLPANVPLSPGRVLVTLPWGSGPGEVGLQIAPEGLSRGPEGLAVSPDGRLAVLDGVNSRIVLLSATGDPLGAISLDLTSPRFVAATNEWVGVLDADADHRLLVFAWNGCPEKELVIPDADRPVTGLLADEGGGFAVEYAHDDVFSVVPPSPEVSALQAASAAGRRGPTRLPQASVLRPLPGRSGGISQGNHARARLLNREQAGVRLERRRGSATEVLDIRLDSPTPLEQLVALAPDNGGGVILAARAGEAAAGTGHTRLLLARVTPAAGSSAPLVCALGVDTPDTVYVGDPLVIGPNGTVYQPTAGPDGYTIRVHRLPEGVSR